MIGSIIRARRTMYLHDTVNPITRPLKRETSELSKPIMAYVGVPLTLRDRVIGVMAVQNYRPNVYTQDQIRLLEHIAVHAAIAIENARLYSEEQRLAIIDELTGIYNYRGLVELGTREVERARRFKRPLSMLFFDIDDFRKFNNTFSHGIGNLILQTVAQRCRTTLRSVDVFARYGGDEFVALLPETDLTEAREVARRLYDEIRTTKITTSYGELGVTISIGVTAFSEDIPDLYKLIDRANHGERQAKQNGLGVVVTAQE
jgi:diguanylate cyclase (GGDEF)-like protein